MFWCLVGLVLGCLSVVKIVEMAILFLKFIDCCLLVAVLVVEVFWSFNVMTVLRSSNEIDVWVRVLKINQIHVLFLELIRRSESL